MSDSKPDEARDNRANQLNPTHPAFYRSRGASQQEAEELAREAQLQLEAQRAQGSKA